MASLEENNTWTEVEPPLDRKVVKCKWVFKLKYKPDGSIERYKARLVARGFSQEYGIDYQQTYAPVVKMASLRLILALAIDRSWFLRQLDVSTTFLYGDLDTIVYMEYPKTTLEEKNETKVCLLRKSLYGLKQSPRMWNQKIDEFFKNYGFSSLYVDYGVYDGKFGGGELLLGLYVDDILVSGSNLDIIDHFTCVLSENFKIHDLGEPKFLLGMELTFNDDRSVMTISQMRYTAQILERFNVGDANTSGAPLPLGTVLDDDDSPTLESDVPYREAIGCVMYLMTCTRPDIACAVSMASKYLSHPRRSHWTAVKHVLSYVASTRNQCLEYRRFATSFIDVFSDSDFANDRESRRSRSGHAVMLSYKLISWSSKLQEIVTLSSTEAEYVAAIDAGKEAIWVKNFMNFMKALLSLNEDGVIVD
jgi:hypothetical protein